MSSSMIAMSLTIAAIGAGLMAGVYFAFSAFIMRSLDQLAAPQAVEAMNAINKVIVRSWFMVLFFGSTLLYAILSTMALLNAELPGRWLLFATGLVYVFGMFICTIVFNVPLNNGLAEVSNDDRTRSDAWKHYSKRWTQWNHLRCACSLAGMILSMHYLANYS